MSGSGKEGKILGYIFNERATDKGHKVHSKIKKPPPVALGW
jgi:hypothetical protein